MRRALTVLVILAGLVVVVSVLLKGQADRSKTPAPTTPAAPTSPSEPDADAPGSAEAAPADPQSTSPAGEDATPPPTTPAAKAATEPLPAIPGLHADGFHEARVPILGSTEDTSGYKIEVDFSAWGASIMRIQLADYDETVRDASPYVIVDAPIDPDDPAGKRRFFPFAARSISINGSRVSLADARWELTEPSQWRTTYERTAKDAQRTVQGQATYVLTIRDKENQAIVELRRTFSVDKGSYHLRCLQQIINRTDQPLTVVWEQLGHGDIAPDKTTYMGDARKMTAGYFTPHEDLKRQYIQSDVWTGRAKLLEDRRKGTASAQPLWPNDGLRPDAELVWVASVNRYFALATHADITAAERPVPGTAPALQSSFPSLRLAMRGSEIGVRGDRRALAFVLTSNSIDLAAGATADLDLGLYAGPRQSDVLAMPVNKALQLGQLIKYELGCVWCTFQPLAKALLAFLEGIYFVVRDWAIGIILLVIVVRLVLHPITKKSQVQMMTMGKKMQTLQPEIEKLKKKYKDNQQTLNKEMMKLYREKGANPAGMLGCLPMFLQMPIWIALYAMLFLAIDLRHQPAFYGFFQLFGGWSFLADLSSPDAFIRFADEEVRLSFPLLSSLDFSTFNILPLLWAVVMFFQQKYMTPPAANDQQAQQQKMMKYMTLLFPLFLYSAPSGLTLYILASSGAGIVDSKLVRKHIKEQEDAGTLIKEKKPRKPGGFIDRLAKALEARQKDMADRRGTQGPSRNQPRRKNKR